MSTKEVPFVAVVAYSNSDCTVAINSKRYVYRSSIPGYKIKEKVEGILKYSPGKAIQWLKENAEVIDKYEV